MADTDAGRGGFLPTETRGQSSEQGPPATVSIPFWVFSLLQLDESPILHVDWSIEIFFFDRREPIPGFQPGSLRALGIAPYTLEG